MFEDTSKIWAEEVFPIRFPVKPLVMLKAEYGVPMGEFKGKLSFYPAEAEPVSWSGLVRGSLITYQKADGDVVAAAIRAAASDPVSRPVDPKKLKRSSNLYKLNKKVGDEEIETVVTVPTEDEDEGQPGLVEAGSPTHTEIQWRLLDLGSQMGLNIWAPKSDRGKSWNGSEISKLPRLLTPASHAVR